jgi:hypothetical protein
MAPKGTKRLKPEWDMLGRVIGKLTVTARLPNDSRGTAQWEVTCECGAKHTKSGFDIRSGRIKSCQKCVERGPSEKTIEILKQIKETGKRECSTCHDTYPIIDFGAERRNKHLKTPSRCKHCRRKEWFRKQYNLEEKDIEIMGKNQKGLCAACLLPLPTTENGSYLVGKIVAIDHNHITGKIRGLLHTQCNTIIGLCYEEVKTLEAIIEYINKDKNN